MVTFAMTVICLGVLLEAVQAQTVYQGTSGVDLDNAAAWSDGIPNGQTATINVDGANLPRWQYKTTATTTINHTGGTLSFVSAYNMYTDGNNSSLLTYNMSGGGFVFASGCEFNVNGHVFNLSGGLIDVSSGTQFRLLNNGILQLSGSGTLDAPTIGGTVGTMNFVSGWTGSVTIDDLDAASWKTMLATTLAGSTFDGVDITTDNFDYFFAVDGAGTLTLRDAPLTLTWDGDGGDDNWATVANWGPDAIVLSGDDLTFAGTTGLTPNNDLAANTDIAGITFDNTAGAFTIGGNVIDLTGNIVNNDTDLQTLGLDMRLTGGHRQVNTASGDITITGDISQDASNRQLQKTGSGTLTLTGANSHSGGTTLSSGTLVLGAAAAAGTGTITLSGGTLDTVATTYINNISATGSAAINNSAGTVTFNTGTVTGAGTLAFSVAQQTRFFSDLSGFSGTISHDNDAGGQLRLWNQVEDLSATKIVTSGGTSGSGLQFINSGNDHTIGELSGTGGKILMRGGSGLTLTVDQSTDTTYSGLLQDGDASRKGTLVKDGVGTLTLDGANTYSGTTTIDGGTLLVNNASGSATGTGALNVNSGGTLGGTGTVSGVVTVNSGGHISVNASNSEISLTGGLTLNAGAVLDVDLSSYAGGSTKVIVDYDGALSGTFAVTNLTAGWTADIDYAHDQGGSDLAIALIGIREYQTLTWDDGAGDDNWSSGANWVGDPVVGPVDGDSVVLTTTAQSILDGAWTIVNGASLTSETSGVGDELVLQSDSDLTLATGGTMDIGFIRPRFSSGGQFTIEPGASLDTDAYGLGSISATITFEANAGGVTVWNNTGQFQMGGDNLVVDLSNYDIANGTTLVLVDYNVAGDLGGQTFASVDVFGGLTGTLDYAYDQGGGDLAIAITGIGVPGTIFRFR